MDHWRDRHDNRERRPVAPRDASPRLGYVWSTPISSSIRHCARVLLADFFRSCSSGSEALLQRYKFLKLTKPIECDVDLIGRGFAGLALGLKLQDDERFAV